MPEWLYFIIGQAFTAGAVYGAIKGDIKGAIKDAAHAIDSANEAHKRIDTMLMKG